jgi:hypothetical protein
MIKELVEPAANFNMMVSKVGGVLVKTFDKPLGYAINWDEFGHYGLFIWRQHAAA